MANVRSLNKDKYNISEFRFRELYYFCLQYEEWRERLEELRNPLKGLQYSDMPSSGVPGDPTMNQGIECAEYSQKCEAIEAAARAADLELQEYLIYAVTNKDITFNKLKAQRNIPCERDRYYNSRRKFYYHLDRILRRHGVNK